MSAHEQELARLELLRTRLEIEPELVHRRMRAAMLVTVGLQTFDVVGWAREQGVSARDAWKIHERATSLFIARRGTHPLVFTIEDLPLVERAHREHIGRIDFWADEDSTHVHGWSSGEGVWVCRCGMTADEYPIRSARARFAA